MAKQFETLSDLKRMVYLWVLPWLFVALVLNTILQNMDAANILTFIINNTLTVWFALSWVLLFKSRFVRFIEYSNLILISIYHIATFFDTVHHYLLKSGGSLGDFIIWMPIYFMFIFLTLGTKRGFFFSIGIFAVTLVDGLLYINKLPSESIDSLLQYYFANFVYIIAFFFAQHMFFAYTKMEVLKKQAFQDPLTGIANRHRIDEFLQTKLKDCQEMNTSFSIIFFDIDHFKKVNDLYGHKVGDSVLIEMAELIQSKLSNRDLFGRWGGEEFIIITDALQQGALGLAEQLRKKVEEHTFNEAGRLTASFGVTGFRVSDSLDNILSRVDEGLYQSKNRGRNKVSSVS